MEKMDAPLTRDEFERRFYILKESLINGKFHITANCDKMADSLVKIRELPNKRIDLLTIDESARVTANMMVNGPYTEEEESDV
jgi:hypothetical protein